MEITFPELMMIANFRQYPADEAIDLIGQLIDSSEDSKMEEGIVRAIASGEKLLTRPLTSAQRSLLHYFLANAWSARAHFMYGSKRQMWDWESEAIEQEIVSLRKSLIEKGFAELPVMRQCQVLTNLGNLMDHIGRFVDALDYWNAAIGLVPAFGMAVGNRSMGFATYSDALYDRGHSCIFRHRAMGDLSDALTMPIHEHAGAPFRSYLARLQKITPKCRHSVCFERKYSIGRSQGERMYRQWCLDKRLFLNPVNDLGPYTFAAQDILSLPDMVVPLGAGPAFPGLYSQLKQEYVSARYQYYEGCQATSPHFSDRGVRVYDTLEYPVYSLAAEKIKMAFRMAYSLFDKIAYFLNAYLGLGIADRQVSFRGMWYEGKGKGRTLRKEFQQRPNLPLRGLFWLGIDLHDDDPDFREAIDPLARDLADMRNSLEHKYLGLHEFGPFEPPRLIELPAGYVEPVAYAVGRSDFEASTLHILKLARSGLMYLTLAIHAEEQRLAQARPPDAILPPELLGLWDDRWKV